MPCSSGRWGSRSTCTASTPIKALLNVGLARGLPGRRNRGLVPIRGHSGVQGGAEVGCLPERRCGHARPLERRLGIPGAADPGGRPRRWSSTRARATSTCSGWWAATSSRRCPTPTASREALRRPRLRIHQDIVLSSSMLVDCDGDVLLLPAGDPLRIAGRRNRNVHRAAHHLLAGDPRAPDWLGAAGVVGVRAR